MSETTDTGLPPDTQLPPAAEAAPAENPRNAIMRRIADHYDETIRPAEIEHGDRLLQEAGGEPDEEKPPAEAPTEPALLPEPVQETPVQAAPPAPAPMASATLRSVILPDGRQFQVTDEQFSQLASMGAVANLMAVQQRQAAPPPPPPPVEVHQPQQVLDRDRAAQLVQRLSYGSQEDGVAAVQELAAEIASRVQAPQQTVDPNRIGQQVLQHIQLERDLERIGTEFPDIWRSRALTVGAAAELNDIRQRDLTLGVNRPAIEQYREACRNLLGQLPQQAQLQSAGDAAPSPAPQAAIQVSASPRLERKRAAPRNPAGVSRVASLGDPMPQTTPNASIVAKMREQRQQPLQ